MNAWPQAKHDSCNSQMIHFVHLFPFVINLSPQTPHYHIMLLLSCHSDPTELWQSSINFLIETHLRFTKANYSHFPGSKKKSHKQDTPSSLLQSMAAVSPRQPNVQNVKHLQLEFSEVLNIPPHHTKQQRL